MKMGKSSTRVMMGRQREGNEGGRVEENEKEDLGEGNERRQRDVDKEMGGEGGGRRNAPTHAHR